MEFVKAWEQTIRGFLWFHLEPERSELVELNGFDLDLNPWLGWFGFGLCHMQTRTHKPRT